MNDKLILTIDFGSFKKSEDEGLGIRQINTSILVRQLTNDVEFKFLNFDKIIDSLIVGLDDVSETLGDQKKDLLYSFIGKYFYQLFGACAYNFDKFKDDRSNIIYRKFRINKPTDELMTATMTIFARLNVM